MNPFLKSSARSGQKAVWKFLLLPVFLLAANTVFAEPDLSQIQKGQLLLEEWRIEEAETFLRPLLKKFPQSGDVHFLNARLQFLKGRYDLAGEILNHISDRQSHIVEFKSLVKRTREAAAGFVSRESDHFVFRYMDGPDQILFHYAQTVLERSYHVLGQLFDYFPQEKVLVEIYPSRQPFSQISPLTLEDIVTSGTVALCKYNRLMIISPASLVRGYNWMDTLSHEYIHYLLTRKSYNNVPLWLHEGIAKYFETLWRGEPEPLTPLMETVLASGLGHDYLIQLRDMMPSLAKLKTAEDVQLAYAEVSTMVEYMVSLQGRDIIPRLVEDLAKGRSIEAALELRLGQDLFAFQKDWKRHMKEKNLKSIPGMKALRFRFKDQQGADDKEDYRVLESKEARDWAFLGDILQSRNHLEAAIIEYQKSIKQSKTFSPVLYNKLAKALMSRKNYDEAKPLLAKALQHYPMFPSTLTNLGELYFQTEQYREALGYFERAIRINPFNPWVHQRLIKIFGLLDNPEKVELQARLFSYLE